MVKTYRCNNSAPQTSKISSVELNFAWVGDEEFGMLTGEVHNISLLPDKEGFFAVDVELPKKLITNYNKEIVFTQEMSGVGEIITEDLRLIERFFYQLRNVFKR